MDASRLDYDLPSELIAQRPPEERDGSRLMVVSRADGSLEHCTFRDIGEYLRHGDLLVLNDTKVFPARLVCRRATGGRADVLLVAEKRPGVWTALVSSGGRILEGESLALPGDGGFVRAGGQTGGFREVEFSEGSDVHAVLSEHGRAPLPPYVKRRDENTALDREDLLRYQTVYARNSGSIAAPTAGLHFTERLLKDLEDLGVGTARVTLHVGAATFLPIRSERVEDHEMLPEHCDVPDGTMDAIRSAKQSGCRVICVGTTTCRALETAARQGGRFRGWTELFIRPLFEFRVVDALLTNFHLPRSTLLLLVWAFAGEHVMRRAYSEAVDRRYRFYSYGDAMLIL